MIATALLLVRDLLHFVLLACSSHTSLAAENLFLRKQLAYYVERKVKPRRLMMPRVSHSSCSPVRSSGDRFSSSCDPLHSCGGTDRDSVYFGGGSHGALADLDFPRRSSDWSRTWLGGT
jgi:hypothetical protein